MKKTMSALGAAAVLILVSAGCASQHEQGVRSDYRTQWTKVAADPQKTTDAAKSVLNDMEFKDVNSSATTKDGHAEGKLADGTKVKVDVTKEDVGSEVSVTIGTVGDPKLGAEIAKKVKMMAEQ